MPGLDGTGPRGMGSMTGRGFGKCRGTGQTNGVVSIEQAPYGAVQPGESQTQSAVRAPFYGAGRGGIPCGCGNGRRFGGGRGCRRG
ncbi:hypothetical protein SDC9_39590 [bioreactor metagenome]|uniref:DUF5320 domain-containing protein n=1 Tax=bioreactor metagenome TaxID=1076179 RepID=A0A644VSG7_9ZZZZ